MNGKHTPGPWTIKENYKAGGVNHLAILANDGQMPASITPMHLRRKEDDANAKLIAAAPDLLAALQSITASYDKLLEAYGKPHGWGTIESDMAKAAIAKAGGEA